MDRLQCWAPEEALVLHVHEDNPRARAAYEKLGFRATGESVAFVLDPAAKLLEMTRTP